MDALDNRPIFIRLKGLVMMIHFWLYFTIHLPICLFTHLSFCCLLKDCMRGPLAKARVLYVPVEEIGDEGRLLRACRILFF